MLRPEEPGCSGATGCDGLLAPDGPAGLYIKQAAQIVGVSASTIRFWEGQGLVAPPRTPAGYRVYGLAEIKRLRQVRDLFVQGLNAAAVRRELGSTARRTTNHVDAHGLGPRLRAVRKQQKLSLRQLASETGLSPSHISSLERSLSAPSVASLQKLTAALGTNLIRLLGHQRRGRDRTVVSAREQKEVRLGIPGVTILELAQVETQLEPLLFRLEPGACSAASYSHDGEEFLYVLDGAFEVTLDGAMAYPLLSGDAMTFRSHRPHSWRNPGDRTAVVIWINTPPTF